MGTAAASPPPQLRLADASPTNYVAQAPRSFLLRALCQLAGLTPTGTLPASDPVTASAQRCAAARAVETLRGGDALTVDPLARLLAGAQYDACMRCGATLRARPRIAIRTRYFDAFASTRLSSTPHAQLVLLGAGMDARVYRLDALGAANVVFEVDGASVLDVKEHLLRSARPHPVPRCAVRRIRADIADQSWAAELLRAGFDHTRPTVWLLEGLMYYLTPLRVIQLLREMRCLSAPGSWLCFSAVTRFREGVSSNFVSAMPHPITTVTEAGFAFYSVDVLGGPNANFGRWPVATPHLSSGKLGALPSGKGATIYVKARVPKIE